MKICTRKNLADINGFTVIRNVLYGYYGQEKNVIVPDGVIKIGRFAFGGLSGRMDNLVSAILPHGVTEIGPYAFDFCRNLTSIIIPDSVVRFGEDTFSGCDNLTIHAPAGCRAERYAKENNIPFVAI